MAKKSTDPAARPLTRRRSAGAASSPRVVDDTAVRRPTHEEIAEAAYHRYLSRGAEHGRDFDDWVEAERELKRRPD
jgi:hypothetical protein